MTEPTTRARRIDTVVPDVWEWTIEDDRIGGFPSSSYAFTTGDGTVLVDPLPLEPDLVGNLGTVHAIVLASGSHQRAAWRYRRELGAPVWIPELVRENEEEPDERYSDGDTLPGGLKAFFTPGAGTTQHSLLLEDRRVLFCPDLLMLPPGGELALVPPQYMHDPGRARESAASLLDLEFDVLCTGHGGAVASDAKAALRAALERPEAQPG